MSKLKTEYKCALLLSMDLIGGKWKIRILWHMFHGENRFSMLARSIPEISHKVLAEQLKEMEETGMIIRQVIKEKPPRIVEYSVNERYWELSPILEKLCIFGCEYASDNHIQILTKK